MSVFRRLTLVATLCLVLAASGSAAGRAKNVILFLADAGGIPTLNAASAHGYNAPQKLYVQSWPNIALSDTSAADNWVTDSAAGMTAIVTGVKSNNSVISQGPGAVRGKRDGAPLKTLLEYAEERGLSTGLVSNVSITDATPAALYAHANDRGKWGDIFLQLFRPRFGDGADVVIGAGRKQIYDQVAALGASVDAAAAEAKRQVYGSLAAVPSTNSRPIVVSDDAPDVPAAAKLAVRLLSQNPKGYFLMVEWDTHTDKPRAGLDNLVNFDKLIRELSAAVDLENTLLLFTADHSFDLRSVGGTRGPSILTGLDEWGSTHTPNEEIVLPALRIGNRHTGEEVLVAAQGPGATEVRGFLPNTRLFHVVMDAFGWRADGR